MAQVAGRGEWEEDQGRERVPISLQKRFSDQRAKLLALEYHDPFTTESLALVERLFNDLVTTTESYEDLQQREERTAAELALNRAQLFPLKKENARLIRDNNLLHLKVIKAAEKASAAERSALLQGKKAEAEQGENRCRIAQKDARIAELEKQVEALRTLDDDCGGTRTRGKGGLERWVEVQLDAWQKGLKREMEISDPLPAAREGGRKREQGKSRGVFSTGGMRFEDDPLVGVVETLQKRLEEASSSLASMEEERLRLEEQVEAREKEIARLGRQLGNDSALEKVTLAHAHEANRRIVEQLNDQVDFLNKQLATREDQLSKAREDFDKLKSGKTATEIQLGRLEAHADNLEENNSRLTATIEEFHKNASAGMGDTELEEALKKAKDCAAKAEVEVETLRRRLDLVGDGPAAAGTVNHTGVVQEGDLAAMKEENRSQAELQRARDEARALRLELARLRVDALSSAEKLERLTRERQDLLERLQVFAARETAEGESVRRGSFREGIAEEGRSEEEVQRRRVTSQRLSVAEDNAEFMSKEAEAVRRELGVVNQRVTMAEARAGDAEREALGLERALRAETLRALEAEGEAANARANGGGEGVEGGYDVEGAKKRMQELETRLAASESARVALSEEINRLAGQGSLLGAESFAQASRLEALEREKSKTAEDLRARERDVAELLEQKRALEAEVSRARRAVSRGALETATMAHEELALQARAEEAADEVRGLRAEVTRLTDRLLAEEEKAAAARDETDRLAARLSHRSAGLEGLEAEVASLRAALTVARSEGAEREGICARMEAEAERGRATVSALERRVLELREAVSDKDGEIGRLKALARQLEGSRETLKASEEAARVALRDAELRMGQVSTGEDGAKRDAEAAREESVRLRCSLAELDAERDRLQDTLDEQSEKLAALREADQVWQQRVAEAEQRLREEGSRCLELERALEAAGRRAAGSERSAAEELLKAEALASALEGKTRQLAAATEDLEAIAKENQAVTAELNRVGQERDERRREVGDALHRRAESERAARSALFEKEDVLKNYRGLHAEKRRLEAAVDELQLTRERLTKSLAERDAEVSRLRASVTAIEVQLQRKTIDLGAVQQQVENLSAQLLRGGRQVEALAAENRRLVAAARAQRHHANSMIERIRSQQGHSANAEQEVKSLRARLQALEEERDGLSHILGRERSHGTGLEQLIEASRLREASVAAEQRQLAREKDRLETKAARLAEELTQARNCLADMSSRVSGSRREDSSCNSSNVPLTPASSNLLESSSPRGGSGGISEGARAPRTTGVERLRQQQQQRGGGGSTIDGEPRAFLDAIAWSRGGRNVGLEEKAEEAAARSSPFVEQQQERLSPRNAVERRRSGRVLGESDGGRGQGDGVWGDGRGASHGQKEEEEDSGMLYLEDMRGFVRREGQRLRESVRTRRTGGGSG